MNHFERVVEEFKKTEVNYSKSLHILHTVYVLPLQEQFADDDTMAEHVCDMSSNIKALARFHGIIRSTFTTQYVVLYVVVCPCGHIVFSSNSL